MRAKVPDIPATCRTFTTIHAVASGYDRNSWMLFRRRQKEDTIDCIEFVLNRGWVFTRGTHTHISTDNNTNSWMSTQTQIICLASLSTILTHQIRAKLNVCESKTKYLFNWIKFTVCSAIRCLGFSMDSSWSLVQYWRWILNADRCTHPNRLHRLGVTWMYATL